MKNLTFSEWILIAILILASVFFLTVLSPLLIDIVVAVILASLFWGLNSKLSSSTGPRLASVITIVVLLIIIVVPIVIIGTYVVNATGPAINSMQQSIPQIEQQLRGSNIQNFIQNTPILNQLSQYISPSALVNIVYSLITQALNYATRFLQAMISQASQFIFHLFVTFVLIYFLFAYGDRLVDRINRVVTLHKFDLWESTHLAVNAYILRSIVSGLVHFAISWALFALFGVPYALLWAVAMIPLAFFPMLGNALVYIVAGAYKLAIGDALLGIILLLIGFIVPPLIDRFIRPTIISKRETINPGILILSALGGLIVFGFPGIVIGPVAAIVFIVVWEHTSEELGSRDTKETLYR